MIFRQLASAVMLFAKFDAGARKSLQDNWPLLLEHPTKFVLTHLKGNNLTLTYQAL